MEDWGGDEDAEEEDAAAALVFSGLGIWESGGETRVGGRGAGLPGAKGVVELHFGFVWELDSCRDPRPIPGAKSP